MATLCAAMIRLAVHELGEEAVQRKLGHIAAVRESSSADEMIHQLLTCVYQSTRNSGDVTRNAARRVAARPGARPPRPRRPEALLARVLGRDRRHLPEAQPRADLR